MKRLATLLALCALAPSASCDLAAGDPKLTPIPQAVRERGGQDPDRDLLAKAHDGLLAGEIVWSATGYEQRRFGWGLPFEDAPARRLAPPPWRLDNWTEKAPGQFEAKDGPGYVGTLEVDDDGDGRIDAWERHEEPIFDLMFANDEDDGLIWIKTRTIEPSSAPRKLELVVRDYLDSLTGTNTSAHIDIFGREHERTRHLTTLVRQIRESRVGAHRAIEASAEIADAAALSVNPRSRLGRVTLVIARIGYLVPRGSAAERSSWPSIERNGFTYWKKTAIFVVGRFSALDDAGTGASLADLAGRLRFTDLSVVVDEPRPAEPARPDLGGASAI